MTCPRTPPPPPPYSNHAAVTALGLPAYLEKPPTLDHAELERMITADSRAGKSSLVGFNFIIEKQRLALKERLLAGEFGGLRGATLSALWPRPASYFQRNDWAGRLMIADASGAFTWYVSTAGGVSGNTSAGALLAGGPALMVLAEN